MEPIIANRIAAIRSILTKENLDAILILIQENRFYLSGYTGEDTQFDESAGALVISADQLFLATDSRFDLQAQNEAGGYEIVIYKQGLEQVLPEIVESLGASRLGFESVRISHKQHAALSKALAGQTPAAELIPTENAVENLREIKSEDEIERTIRALRLAEGAFSKVLADLRPGLTEKEVAWSMEKAMREMGAEGLSFPVIVASGPNSASPHAIPSDRRLKTGEPILFDWGVRLDRYCSDTTRTVILGHLDDRFKKVFDTVVEARDKATAAIQAGVGGMAIDSIARDHIDKNGFAGKFGHSLGHGTGLAIHEAPRLSPIRDERLETGMIVTVEPGIYLPGWGGIRMENQVVVRDHGADVLNDPTPFDPLLKV